MNQANDIVVSEQAVREELDRLLPAEKRMPFVAFMESLHLDGLDLCRESDQGRDVDL